jgi:hypothetical protein
MVTILCYVIVNKVIKHSPYCIPNCLFITRDALLMSKQPQDFDMRLGFYSDAILQFHFVRINLDDSASPPQKPAKAI